MYIWFNKSNTKLWYPSYSFYPFCQGVKFFLFIHCSSSGIIVDRINNNNGHIYLPFSLPVPKTTVTFTDKSKILTTVSHWIKIHLYHEDLYKYFPLKECFRFPGHNHRLWNVLLSITVAYVTLVYVFFYFCIFSPPIYALHTRTVVLVQSSIDLLVYVALVLSNTEKTYSRTKRAIDIFYQLNMFFFLDKCDITFFSECSASYSPWIQEAHNTLRSYTV